MVLSILTMFIMHVLYFTTMPDAKRKFHHRIGSSKNLMELGMKCCSPIFYQIKPGVVEGNDY